MRDVTKLLTSEMTPEEWDRFRDLWVEEYAAVEARETGCPRDVELAEIRFEDYCGQEGYTRRNERIAFRRDTIVDNFPENPAWKPHRVVVDDSLGELVVVEGLNLPEERRWGLFTPSGEHVRHCTRDVR